MTTQTRLIRTVLLLAAILASTIASAQEHAKWSIAGATGKAGDVVTLSLQAKIDPGWHLYSIVPVKGTGPVPTTITASLPLTLAGPVTEAKPITKLDPNFNLQVQFFQDSAVFQVPVKLGPAGVAGNVNVRFQLCNDTTCIPPATVSVPLTGGAAAPVGAIGTKLGPAGSDYVGNLAAARDKGLLTFMGFAFVAGLLSLLTPCVFPMIPITVSFFAKRRQAGSGVTEAIAYCAGIIGSFAIFGMLVSIIFGASGIQAFATNAFVNLALAALFVVLAISLLGLLNINLPSGLVNKFSGAQGKGGLAAAAFMGLTFTLTTFTCTVPFVGTILAGAAQGDYVYPLVGMLAYGTAFALPFFLLAMFPQYLAKLPKSGSWLETVKAFMGFIELAAALKFFSNADLVLQTHLISRPTFLAIWAVLALVAGLYLLGFVRLPGHGAVSKRGPIRLIFAFGSIATAIWFGLSLRSPSLGELEAFMPPTESGWIQNYQRALQVAQQKNEPILINFTGVTCTNCRMMEDNMFPRPAVKQELKHYVTVELYTDRDRAGDEQNKELEQQLTGVVTLPEYVLLTSQGKKITDFPGSTRSESDFVSFLKAGYGNRLAMDR